MGKGLTAILALFLSTGFSVIVPPATSLAWLSGHWMQKGPDDRWAEERWGEPRYDTMLGTGLTGKGFEVRSFEFMRIQGSTFWGSPQGQKPVPFKLVEQGPRFVAFENPQHDYPVRISYKREGRMLIATTSGPGGANPQTWRYRRTSD